MLFMVPLGHPGVRSMAQVLRLPFDHLSIILYISKCIRLNFITSWGGRTFG